MTAPTMRSKPGESGAKEAYPHETEARQTIARQNAMILQLREELATLKATSNINQPSQDMGAAARQALTRMRDVDLPELQKAVYRIPDIAAGDGPEAALDFCQNTVLSLVLTFDFAPQQTADLVKRQHQTLMMLTEGQVELMFRNDRAGARFRREFLQCVILYYYGSAVRFVAAHGQETPPGLMGYR